MFLTQGIALGQGGCLPGQLPPPSDVAATIFHTGRSTLSEILLTHWSSVDCATGYAVKLVNDDGSFVTKMTDKTSFDDLGGIYPRLKWISVASVGEGGAQGEFSPLQETPNAARK